MRRHRLLLAVACVALLGTLASDVQANGIGRNSGLPWFGYGYSGSLYGLGRLPVPPYFSIHPPVYYGLPQSRPYGLSPYAYRGEYQLPVRVAPRFVRNPHFEAVPLPAPIESPSETTTSTARVILNPYFSDAIGAESQLVSQTE